MQVVVIGTGCNDVVEAARGDTDDVYADQW